MARRRGEPGFTAIEILIVVALIGLIAAIAIVQISKAWQRAQLDSEAGNIRAFFQSAYTFMVNNRAAVYVHLVRNGGTVPPVLSIVSLNPDNTINKVYSTHTVPTYISLSTTSTSLGDLDANTVFPAWPATCPFNNIVGSSNYAEGMLECDATGRAMDPPALTLTCLIPTMVIGPQRLFVTHQNMVAGSLTPRIVYTLQVSPLWNVTLIKTVS